MNDDTLLLYYYKDGLTRAERRDVTEALAGDPAIATRYSALTAQLESLREESAPPLAQDLKQRLHATIDRAAGAGHRAESRPKTTLHFVSFLLGTAITAALVLGVGIGVWLSNGDGADAVPPVIADAVPADGGPFERGLKVYFRQSKLGLETFPAENADQRAAIVATLIAQNNLYAHLAERNDSPELARVLRAFDPILRKLAAEDITPDEAAALRAKLEFEINVMLTRLMQESSKATDSTEQEI